jgi:hypothetical protein
MQCSTHPQRGMLPDEMKKTDGKAKSSLEELKLGVWRVLIEKETSTSIGLAARWKKITTVIPTMQKLVFDVYQAGPTLLTLIFLSKAWSSFEDVFLLHLSSRILTIVSYLHPYDATRA